MRNIFEKEINGVAYTFYRIPIMGEIVYNISYLYDGEREIFLVRKKDGRWRLNEKSLEKFVYNSEPSLEDAIMENEHS